MLAIAKLNLYFRGARANRCARKTDVFAVKQTPTVCLRKQIRILIYSHFTAIEWDQQSFLNGTLWNFVFHKSFRQRQQACVYFQRTTSYFLPIRSVDPVSIISFASPGLINIPFVVLMR